MTRVLLCTDGSAYSQVCCQYAAWLAGRVPCEFEVLYVTDLRQFEVPMVADLSGSLGVQPYQAVLSKLQELVAQVVAAGGFRIGEIAVPTRYFEEASSVGFRRSVVYGLSTLRVVGRFALHRVRVRPSPKLTPRAPRTPGD